MAKYDTTHRFGFSQPDVLERLTKLFPGREIVGYNPFFDWSWAVDYHVIIKWGATFRLVSAELNDNGKDRIGFIASEPFDPQGRETFSGEWIWRTPEDFTNVMRSAGVTTAQASMF